MEVILFEGQIPEEAQVKVEQVEEPHLVVVDTKEVYSTNVN